MGSALKVSIEICEGVPTMATVHKKYQTLQRILFGFLVLIFGVGSSTSEGAEMLTGMEVLLVSKGDLVRPDKAWFNPGSDMLLNERSGNLFRIFAEDLVQGKTIQDGDYVRIRLAEGDRWVRPLPQDGRVNMFSGSRGLPSGSLLQIKRIVYTRRGRGVITSGPFMLDDPFSLRVADQDVWLKISDDQKRIVTTSSPQSASYFIFTLGVPLPLPAPAPAPTPTPKPATTPPVTYSGIPMSQGPERPPAITCSGGVLTTYIPCDPCTVSGLRQTRSQAKCTEALDIHGRGCSGKSCEACMCEPN